jgi:hypothetical protein
MLDGNRKRTDLENTVKETASRPLSLNLCPYIEQESAWPASGRHIMAQFDSESIIVYQAYRPSIAEFAVEHQKFGGDFSYARMSWIKPNFLWMMFRSGWAKKEGQERILAVRLELSFFEEILQACVASTFTASGFSKEEDWRHALAHSDVRLQWDPDHDPAGNCVQRRAVQLGIRGDLLRRYGTEAPISIEDITPLVVQQRQHLVDHYAELVTPSETVYLSSRLAAQRVGIDSLPRFQGRQPSPL